jgi:hypothetical protein
MKHTMISMSILALAACGGKSAPVQPKEPAPEPTPVVETKPEPVPEPPPPPPPPKTWRAQAELTPVKGVKLKAATVTFSQQEGQQAIVGSKGWFDGIKSGPYHLVVHEAAECGPNATKVGKPTATAEMPLVAAVGMDSVDIGKIEGVQLDGDATIVGHTLVLHDDKKGKPGKALACGPIASAGE